MSKSMIDTEAGPPTDPEVIRITSMFQFGKSPDGALLISRSRDAADPKEIWFEFGSTEIAFGFALNMLDALNDYVARELDTVLP